MLVVAIVALVLWSRETMQRRAYYQRRAAYWASQEQEASKMAAELKGEASEIWQAWSAVERGRATRFGQLRQKYERGASHPWSLIAPDWDEYQGRIWPGVGFVAEGLEGEKYPGDE